MARLVARRTLRHDSVTLWGPAPNRHLEPLLEALEGGKALDGVCYGSEALGWQQLGTAPVRRHGELLIPRAGRSAAVRRILSEASGVHLMASFANRLCFSAMAQCAGARIPYFVLAESFTPRGMSPRGFVRDAVYRYLLRNVTGVFALSPACARDFLRVGVPADRIFPGMYPGPRTGDSYGCTDSKRLVFCGRLIRIKGLDLLLASLRDQAARGKALRLDIIGAGPELDAHRHLFAGAGIQVVEHGAVSSARVSEIIRGAGALVLPTRFWEGWGYVVNEALAAGVPAVVSDVVAARELVVDGRNGAVFRAEDVSSLSAAIERALAIHNDRSAAQMAFEVSQGGLSASRFASYMLAVMRGCVAGHPILEVPPWHDAAARLGGNDEVRWWEDFAAIPRARR